MRFPLICAFNKSQCMQCLCVRWTTDHYNSTHESQDRISAWRRGGGLQVVSINVTIKRRLFRIPYMRKGVQGLGNLLIRRIKPSPCLSLRDSCFLFSLIIMGNPVDLAKSHVMWNTLYVKARQLLIEVPQAIKEPAKSRGFTDFHSLLYPSF